MTNDGTLPNKNQIPNPELQNQLDAISGYIVAQTENVTAYQDTGYEDTVMVRDGASQHWQDGTSISTSTKDNQDNPMESEEVISIFLPDGTEYFLHAAQNGSGSLAVEQDGDELYEVFYDGLGEVSEDPQFLESIGLMHRVIMEAPSHEKRTYSRHEIPKNIMFQPLSEQELRDTADRVNRDEVLAELPHIPRPTHRMVTDAGDEWLASNVLSQEGRDYVALYRAQEGGEGYRTSIIYTSRSQASWRLLQGLGSKDNPDWHAKTWFEEFVTLPIGMQAALWQYSEQHPGTKLDLAGKNSFYNDVRTLTTKRFDAFMNGSVSEPVDIAPEGSADFDGANMPVESDNSEPVLYGFDSPLYGKVEARVVPSRNDEFTYLTYTRVSDGIRWIGLIQPNDAKMLDSFLLDKVAVAPGYYESPIEYENRNDAKARHNYEDNTERVVGSVAVRALNGEL
jgi:hypothetical protein